MSAIFSPSGPMSLGFSVVAVSAMTAEICADGKESCWWRPKPLADPGGVECPTLLKQDCRDADVWPTVMGRDAFRRGRWVVEVRPNDESVQAQRTRTDKSFDHRRPASVHDVRLLPFTDVFAHGHTRASAQRHQLSFFNGITKPNNSHSLLALHRTKQPAGFECHLR